MPAAVAAAAGADPEAPPAATLKTMKLPVPTPFVVGVADPAYVPDADATSRS
jgi:hypothetical protein